MAKKSQSVVFNQTHVVKECGKYTPMEVKSDSAITTTSFGERIRKESLPQPP
jgi:hypothetical protein